MSTLVSLDNPILANQDHGGKINGLKKLFNMGFMVPKTFVISPNSQNYIETDEFYRELQAVLLKFTDDDLLAIRSSALGEDGDHDSFAGVFESVLNVPNNAQAVKEAIKTVLNSQNHVKVSSYSGKNFSHKMGVILQKMITPVIAGVAFTDSITTKGKNAVLVEYVDGLGDKLVSGQSNSRSIHCEHGKTPNFSKRLNSVVNTAFSVRNKFGIPMDIEWAIDKKGDLWLLQARPITKRVFVPEKHNSIQSGVVASFGVGAVSGKTYFIDSDLEEAELNSAIQNTPDKCVLLLKYSDTAYLPAMDKAVGIISTTGSILSHAAIVAREKGIPCIIGIANAAELFPTGTQVKINPSTGAILSDKVSLNPNTSKVDWGELDIYDFIVEQKIRETTVLFEKSKDNDILAHLPEDASAELVEDVELFARLNYKKKPKIYKGDKYLWYFELKRFNKIPEFRKFIKNGKEIVRKQDTILLKQYFEEVDNRCAELAIARDKSNSYYQRFLYDETIQAIHFAAAIYIAQGWSVHKTYGIFKKSELSKNMNFVTFLSLDPNDAALTYSDDLIKTYKFLKHIEIERNEICTKLFKSGAMRYGYFDDREKRASKALNTTAENAVDIFYNSL